MNKYLVILLGAAVVTALGFAFARGTSAGDGTTQPMPPADTDPLRVEAADAAEWIAALNEPREVLFRTAVALPDGTVAERAALSVRTHGRLPESAELEAIEVLERLAAEQEQVLAQLGNSTGTKFALAQAEAMLERDRMLLTAARIRAGDYATIEVNGERPPNAPTHDRIVHGPAGPLDGVLVDIVVHLERAAEPYRDVVAYHDELYHRYWREIVDEFNRREETERVAAIKAFDADDGTPSPLREWVGRGPLQLDRATSLLTY